MDRMCSLVECLGIKTARKDIRRFRTSKMKSIIRHVLLFFLFSCNCMQENKAIVIDLVKSGSQGYKPIIKPDRLFKIDIKRNENSVKITPPKNSDFVLPDGSAKIKVYKFGDFNADKKEDILVSLGACGTGGCIYGLFLNQGGNYYKLAFMDYLKNATFKIEKNGLWTIISSEEIEPYNPSKLQITVFKFDKNTYHYKKSSTYISADN